MNNKEHYEKVAEAHMKAANAYLAASKYSFDVGDTKEGQIAAMIASVYQLSAATLILAAEEAGKGGRNWND